jgi:hypothetical protein
MKKIILISIILLSAIKIFALPKETITIENRTDVDIQYVFVNGETDLEYKDALGAITYTLLPGQKATWPPSHSVELFSEIKATTVDMKVWERSLPLFLQYITKLNLNGACNVIIDKIDRSKIFGQVLYSISPMCREEIPREE